MSGKEMDTMGRNQGGDTYQEDIVDGAVEGEVDGKVLASCLFDGCRFFEEERESVGMRL